MGFHQQKSDEWDSTHGINCVLMAISWGLVVIEWGFIRIQ